MRTLDLEEVRQQRSRLATILRSVRLSPNASVFIPPVAGARLVDFEEIFSPAFFRAACGAATDLRQNAILLGVVEPDPERYFHREFGSTAWYEFSCRDDGGDDYRRASHLGPGGSPADAVAFRGESVVVFASDLRWLVLGDRGAEVAMTTERSPMARSPTR